MTQLDIVQGFGADVARPPLALVGLQATPADPSPWEGLLPWQVSRVRDYIDAELGDRPSLTGAAERARLSPGYFSRRFRQSFGLTFSKFVAQRRIARAQAMMTSTSSSLCQIALACGFADQPHFTRTFGSVTGSTPSHWRRAHRRLDVVPTYLQDLAESDEAHGARQPCGRDFAARRELDRFPSGRALRAKVSASPTWPAEMLTLGAGAA
jgi:AraC-like DNA-binding protein